MSLERMIDEFVNRVNASPHEIYLQDEVPPQLRLPLNSAQFVSKTKFTDWRIVPSDHSTRIEEIEEQLGHSFPPSYRSLICRYSFPAFEIGPLLFFSNTGMPLEWELHTRLFSDELMSPFLQRAGYLQIGNPHFDNYDPICLEVQQHGGDGRVVQICHESILCDNRLEILKTVSTSFEELVRMILDDTTIRGRHAE